MKNPSLRIPVGLVFFTIATSHVNASSVLIRWQNSIGYELKTQFDVLLSSGAPDVPGDGAALELGYYSLATTTSPFLGVWIPFTGQSVLGGQTTTIGDKMEGPGLFNIGSQYHTESDPFILSAVGHPLSIRFYNRVVGITPSFFNAVSSVDWVLQALPEDSLLLMSMDLSQSPLRWEGGQASNSVFQTVLRIPEPGSLLLVGLSSICLLFRRRANG